MIRESRSLPAFRWLIGVYTDSLTVRGVVKLFAWMKRVLEGSALHRLCSGMAMAHRRWLRCREPGRGWQRIGVWYGQSRFFKVLDGAEALVLTVFRHNRLFQFFLEDEV